MEGATCGTECNRGARHQHQTQHTAAKPKVRKKGKTPSRRTCAGPYLSRTQCHQSPQSGTISGQEKQKSCVSRDCQDCQQAPHGDVTKVCIPQNTSGMMEGVVEDTSSVQNIQHHTDICTATPGGLRNLRSTCYLNATLQLLFTWLSCNRSLLQMVSRSPGTSLAQCLVRTWEQMATATAPVRPAAILAALQASDTTLVPNRQHDAVQVLENFLHLFRDRNNNELPGVFDSEIATTMRCQLCDAVSQTSEANPVLHTAITSDSVTQCV